MPGDEVQYEFKNVQSIRGMEGRARAKWEKDGWEFVGQSDAPLLRSKLTFRRPKKQVPRWAWVAGGAVAVVVVISTIIGGVTGGNSAPAATSSPIAAAAATPRSTASQASIEAPTASAAPAAPVTRAEVLTAFRRYIKQRAAANVMVAKAVTHVSFSHRTVRVTFDPSAAGVSRAAFDEFNAFDNLAEFVATPIAFNDDLGNRLRPAIDSIETVRTDGSSLGTYTAAQVLALNELSK